MGNHMRKLPKEECQYLEDHTGFKKPEIMEFYKDFMKMNPDGLMAFKDFQDFLYVIYKDKTETLANHYFRAADKDKSGKINFKEFLLFLNHECTSNATERLQWMFDLFDIDGNGTIEKSEMIKVYKNALEMNDTESSGDLTPEEIANKMFDSCDRNKDNKLTKEEFITTFMEDPVLFAIFCKTPNPAEKEQT